MAAVWCSDLSRRYTRLRIRPASYRRPASQCGNRQTQQVGRASASHLSRPGSCDLDGHVPVSVTPTGACHPGPPETEGTRPSQERRQPPPPLGGPPPPGSCIAPCSRPVATPIRLRPYAIDSGPQTPSRRCSRGIACAKGAGWETSITQVCGRCGERPALRTIPVGNTHASARRHGAATETPNAST